VPQVTGGDQWDLALCDEPRLFPVLGGRCCQSRCVPVTEYWLACVAAS